MRDYQTDISELVREKADGDLQRQDLIPYLFLLPFIIIFGIFWVYPILWGPYLSFFDYSLMGQSEFVGLDNYVSVLSPGSRFINSVSNTLFVGIIVIPAQVVGGLIFAILLDSAYTRFKKTMRNLYIVPVVMSTTVLAVVFGLLFEPNGLVNLILQIIAGATVPWVTDPFWAKISVAVVLIWKNLGIAILLFLAGLQGISDHLYNAAKVDGASRWQQFRYVTLPQLQPITVVVVVLSTSYTLRMFATPYVLTQGGPNQASESIVQVLYYEAFSAIQLGSAAAMGVVLTAMLGTIMILQITLGTREDV